MNVSKYISDLLFNYECVILPGLGGFITNEQSATINRLTNEFKPPFDRIFFNIHLSSDDGLLVSYVSREEGIAYAEAKQLLEEEVENTRSRLNQGETVVFENIGQLKLDEGRNISFEQDFSVNYNTKSFGLGSFVSPMIEREDKREQLAGLILPERKEMKRPEDRRPDKAHSVKKRKMARLPLVVVMLLAIAVAVTWALQNKDDVVNYWENQASLFPFNNTTPRYTPRQDMNTEQAELHSIGEEIERKDNLTPTEDLPMEEGSKTAIGVEMPADHSSSLTKEAELTKEANQPVPSPRPEPVKPNKQYYIIAGSFSQEKNAKKLVATLQSKGFNALIADTNTNGMIRVAYTGVDSFKLAKRELEAIRQEDNAEAWILKK